jgi:hypothetical protein
MSSTVEYTPRICGSPESMALLASSNAWSAASLRSREPVTSSFSSLSPLISGPAERSRSSCRAEEREVAFSVMLVRMRRLSSCSMSSMELWMRSAPKKVAAMTGSAMSETRRVLMRQLRRRTREPCWTGRGDGVSSRSSSGSEGGEWDAA